MKILDTRIAFGGALLLTSVLATQPALAQQTAPAQTQDATRPVRPPAKDAADLDLRAFQSSMGRRPAKPVDEMTPLELAQFMEDSTLEMRQRALAFLSLYPNDPRRWIVVSAILGEMPRFVLQWGEPDATGTVQPLVVDEAAATAWKNRVKELQAQMETASDLPESIKQLRTMMAQAVAKQKAFEARWKAGKEKAPDFTTYTLENEPIKLSDYRGKVVVVDFWASWCGPCKAAMPHVQALAEKYKEQGVVVIGAGTQDKREAFEKFVKQNREKYPDIIWTHDKEESGENRASKALYDVDGIPTQFVIDRKGRVVDVVVGYSPGEVVLDGALAKAGIKVDAATQAQAEADLKKRGS